MNSHMSNPSQTICCYSHVVDSITGFNVHFYNWYVYLVHMFRKFVQMKKRKSSISCSFVLNEIVSNSRLQNTFFSQHRYNNSSNEKNQASRYWFFRMTPLILKCAFFALKKCPITIVNPLISLVKIFLDVVKSIS